jgi:hypothetical protein
MSTLADFSCSLWNVENAAFAIFQRIYSRVNLFAIGNRKEQHIKPKGKKKYERGDSTKQILVHGVMTRIWTGQGYEIGNKKEEI